MIQINDDDLPIVVAEKIITGEKPYYCSEAQRTICKALTGNDHAGETEDMFTIDEIEEIGLYLLTYCRMHENGD